MIRKINVEVARFSKLLVTLPSHMDRQGLSIGDGDMLVILLRSMPEEAKKYVLHHSTGDTCHVARMAALKFEQQQRLFLNLNLSGKKHVSKMFNLLLQITTNSMSKRGMMLCKPSVVGDVVGSIKHRIATQTCRR